MVLGSIYCESLRGLFWGFDIYVFGIVVLTMFQMFGWGARGHGVALVLSGIVAMASAVLFQGW